MVLQFWHFLTPYSLDPIVQLSYYFVDYSQVELLGLIYPAYHKSFLQILLAH